MFDYINFSKSIKFYREKLGYSQEVLAEKIGIAYKYLGDIERGVSKPSVTTVINILNVFHLTLEECLNKDSKNKIIPKNIKIQEILYYVNSLHLNEKQKKSLLNIINIINEGRN
ncbi:helix-turn-helix transcriptional regulator [Lachnospiraceae bacterium 46-61]